MDANSLIEPEMVEEKRGTGSVSSAAQPLFFLKGIIFAVICFVAGLFNFITQSIFRHDLNSGEFGLVQTVFAEAAFFTVPLAAINHSFSHFFARFEGQGEKEKLQNLQKAAQTLIDWMAIVIGVLACAGVVVLTLVFQSARTGLDFLLMLFTLQSLAVAVSGSFCMGLNRFYLWGALLFAYGVIRVILAWLCLGSEPWAEAALGVTMVADLVLLIPLLTAEEEDEETKQGAEKVKQDRRARHLQAWKALTNREFVTFFAACFSANLAMFLFANVDVIIAQRWFGLVPQNEWTPIFPDEFDSYMTAGVLARSLLYAGAPLLLVFFTQRSRLMKTTLGSLKLFWFHLVCIFMGAIVMVLIRIPYAYLFGGERDSHGNTVTYLYYFAVAMVPVGWLHAVATFCIASRRYIECYLLGAVSILYAVVLFHIGRQPAAMVTYVCAGSTIALLVTLFVGIVRWSRSQP